MKIISTEFGLYNDKYSKIAKDKYGVTNADKLFTVDIQQIPILYPTGNRENFRQGNAYAVINDEFFDELLNTDVVEEKDEEEVIPEVEDMEIEIPEIEINT